MCRPLVEWMVRMLPTGGVAPEPKVWSPEETVAVVGEFFASPFGEPMAREDEHSLRACCGSAPATQPGIRGGRAP
jgi:hypothetical protein